MKYIITDWAHPQYNMALEELLMEDPSYTDDYFFFYIHSPSVIIGKHQNAYEEVDLEYLKKNNIILCRRQTGGGAVYHDEGNLNFSFVENRREKEIDFAKFTSPIIDALASLGVNGVLSGRNDILVGSRKISGNSQRKNASKTLHHGTILFDANIEHMVRSLHVDEAKFLSKAVKSVRSRVANIKELLSTPMDTLQFKAYLLEHLRSSLKLEDMVLSQTDIEKVHALAKAKYGSDAYTFGKNPPFSLRTKRKFPYGLVEVALDVKNEHIQHIKISGDFFFTKDVSLLENALIGTHFSKDCVARVLDSLVLSEYIHQMPPCDFLSLLFS